VAAVTHVLVLAKAPEPGRVKTRLTPPCSPDQAAMIAEAALATTLDAVAQSRAERRIVALAGAPGPWLPPGFEVFPQRGSTLAERLANAWADSGGAGVQIGMDTPQVTPGDLDHALETLTLPSTDAVLGLAHDGGWWLLGLRRPLDVFTGVPMSTARTGAAQLERLRSLGLRVRLTSMRRDVDTWADANAVAAIVPDTQFALVVERARSRCAVGR
jgi:rSAM/selenodomain-associated transferase 1